MPIPIDHRDITLSPGSGEPVHAKVHFHGLTNAPAAEDRVKVTASSATAESTAHEVVVRDGNGSEIVSIHWTIDFDAGTAAWESDQVQFPRSLTPPRTGTPTHFWQPSLPDGATLKMELGATSATCTVSITDTHGAPPFRIRAMRGSLLVFDSEMEATTAVDAMRGRLNVLARAG